METRKDGQMETTPPKKPRERLVVEIDPDLVKRLRTERVETKRPVNHIVEEVLARHYDVELPAVVG
jgi:hypothetical protein